MTAGRQQGGFNREWVLEQIGGDVDLLREIASVFLVDGPDIRRRLEAALQSGDTHTLHATAHCAKSAVGNFGADLAVHTAIKLEDATKNSETERFAPLTAQLCAALLEVEQALKTEISTPY